MRIAIVCWEFGDAQRPRSLAEGLSALGHEVVFFTSEAGAADPRFRVVSIPFARPATKLRSALGVPADVNMAKAARARGRVAAGLVRTAARTFEMLTQYPDKYRGWIPAVRQWLNGDPGAVAGIELVIASTPPASALFVGRMIARASGARLVFDFRDLWTDNPSYPYRGLRRSIDRLAEGRLVKQASAATASTRSFADAIERRYPRLPVTATYTGIDPAPWRGFSPRDPDGRLVFGHFGVWYPQRRSIRPLLESLRRLADSGVVELGKVSVELWGNGADDETWDAVRELGMTEVVRDCGRLDPRDVPAALARVDVALLLAWPEDTISVPLKTHGYIASGKPVLVLGASPRSEMVAILRGVPGAWLAFTSDDADGALKDYWRAVERGEPLTWAPEQRPMPVSQETMVDGLIDLLAEADGTEVTAGARSA